MRAARHAANGKTAATAATPDIPAASAAFGSRTEIHDDIPYEEDRTFGQRQMPLPLLQG